MDGALHHVAGVFSEGVSTLYIDGIRLADNRSAVLGVEPTGVLSLGCWLGHNVHHEGLIDEVRLSSIARYTDDFTLPAGAFTADDNTLRLWHFDEGEGESALDSMRQSDMSLSSVGWEPFALSGSTDTGTAE